MEMLKEMKQMANGHQQMADGQQQLEARMVEARIVDRLSARMDTALSNIKGHVIQLETVLKQHQETTERLID